MLRVGRVTPAARSFWCPPPPVGLTLRVSIAKGTTFYAGLNKGKLVRNAISSNHVLLSTTSVVTTAPCAMSFWPAPFERMPSSQFFA